MVSGPADRSVPASSPQSVLPDKTSIDKVASQLDRLENVDSRDHISHVPASQQSDKHTFMEESLDPMGVAANLQGQTLHDVAEDTAAMNDLDVLSQAPARSISDLGALLETSGRLGWDDLFAPSWDFFETPAPPSADPLSMLAHVANDTPNLMRSHQPSPPSLPPDPISGLEYGGLSPQMLRGSEERGILGDGQTLLRHFRDVLIPHFAPLPMTRKSPWETLIWSSAVQTHAELTYLGSTTVKHASRATLFALLACSAHWLSRTPDVFPTEKAVEISECCAKRAKSHLQSSLQTETSGVEKAKYKEQLMAILSLIALAVRMMVATWQLI